MDYVQIIDDLIPIIGASDKRSRRNGIELTSFFIAQLKQTHDENDANKEVYTFIHMLKDPAVLASETQLRHILDSLCKIPSENAFKTKVVDFLWRLTYSDALPPPIQTLFCQRFSVHLLDTIILVQQSDDDDQTHPSENYSHLVRVAQCVSGVFSALIETIATRMQLDAQLDSGGILQAALTRFLSDVQADLGPIVFRQLYPERMLPLVWLLDTAQQADATIVEQALQSVRQSGDFEQFVVLVTNFPQWIHMWDRCDSTDKSL